MEQLTALRPTTWEEALSEWRGREAERWGWEEHWRERGFASWDAWRATYFTELGLPERSWSLYHVDDPRLVIPKMWAVAYKGWKQYYPADALKARFADIARHPDLPRNGKVVGLQKSFPRPTTIIGIRCRDTVAVFEGLHRCATIALAAESGRQVAGEMAIALTEFGAGEEELFEKAITQKP